jgi:GTP-binding protein
MGGAGYGPWAGDVAHRTSGVLVSDRSGQSNTYALFNLQERSAMIIGSGVEVYEGMIVGENSRRLYDEKRREERSVADR